MKALFVELPAFERLRPDYPTDIEFQTLQEQLKAMIKAELKERSTP